MCPETVVTSCDTQPSPEIVDDSEDGGVQSEGSPYGLDAAVDRNAHDEGDVQPVDMLPPVGLCHGRVGNVRLLGVV